MADCSVFDDFINSLNQQKQTLNCMVCSVLCAGNRVEDRFSDEVAYYSVTIFTPVEDCFSDEVAV